MSEILMIAILTLKYYIENSDTFNFNMVDSRYIYHLPGGSNNSSFVVNPK